MAIQCKDCGDYHDVSNPHCGRPLRDPKPHVCPVCNGSGKVSRPPWVPGDVGYWEASNTQSYECRTCSGTGIVWG